ncbi:MAG: helix-turn-helix transcriptional regulator [Cyanobacteria bacterium J06641_5]
MTPRQKQVLALFLAGESDEAIALQLVVDASTIRRHLANICKSFGLANSAGEHYSHRDELRALFSNVPVREGERAEVSGEAEAASLQEPAFPGGLLDWSTQFRKADSPFPPSIGSPAGHLMNVFFINGTWSLLAFCAPLRLYSMTYGYVMRLQAV